MKLLVTGNLGYVGPLVVKRLRSAYPGAEIFGLDAGYFADCLLDPVCRPEAEIRQIRADVRDVGAEELRGFDAIVHLAGVSNDPIGNAFADATRLVNELGTESLARNAKLAGVRTFVFASSCSVYGFAEDGARGEGSPLNPLTAYAKSKVAAEQALARLAGAQFKVTCLRFATACGISPRLRLDLVLNDFVAAAIASREIRILSDGSPWRPLIDVRDMARAVEWAVGRREDDAGAFLAINVGSSEWNYQVRDLAAAVAAAIPETAIHVNSAAQPDRRSYRVSFDLFRSLAPNHQPQVSLARSIVDLKNGLEAAGAANPGFQPERFVRLKRLLSLRDEGSLQADLRWSSATPVRAEPEPAYA